MSDNNDDDIFAKDPENEVTPEFNSTPNDFQETTGINDIFYLDPIEVFEGSNLNFIYIPSTSLEILQEPRLMYNFLQAYYFLEAALKIDDQILSYLKKLWKDMPIIDEGLDAFSITKALLIKPPYDDNLDKFLESRVQPSMFIEWLKKQYLIDATRLRDIWFDQEMYMSFIFGPMYKRKLENKEHSLLCSSNYLALVNFKYARLENPNKWVHLMHSLLIAKNYTQDFTQFSDEEVDSNHSGKSANTTFNRYANALTRLLVESEELTQNEALENLAISLEIYEFIEDRKLTKLWIIAKMLPLDIMRMLLCPKNASMLPKRPFKEKDELIIERMATNYYNACIAMSPINRDMEDTLKHLSRLTESTLCSITEIRKIIAPLDVITNLNSSIELLSTNLDSVQAALLSQGKVAYQTLDKKDIPPQETNKPPPKPAEIKKQQQQTSSPADVDAMQAFFASLKTSSNKKKGG